MFTAEQFLVIDSKEPRIIVQAAAGTGKTATIVERVRKLVSRNEKVLFLTFSRAAADELVSRSGYASYTFHSYAYFYLKRFYNYKLPSFVDDVDSFSHLLSLFYRVVRRFGFVSSYDHLIVDECQDLNDMQYNIISLLSGHILSSCLVGDPRQCIYSWRGALSHIFDLFPSYTFYHLTETHRCPSSVVSEANSLMPSFSPMFSHKGSGSFLRLSSVKDLPSSFTSSGSVALLVRQNNLRRKLFEEYVRYHTVEDFSVYNTGEEKEESSLIVSTIHHTKGLEFDYVVVLDFDLFDDDEKRLMYVALTRAKKGVALIK